MNHLHIGFIGFGLIGGSVARVLKLKDPNHIITAFCRTKAPLLQARQNGHVDFIAEGVDDSFSQCDYVFLCTPVQHIAGYLEQLKSIIKKDCIITDVGSVKEYIHSSVLELDMEENFIGGHPMAGSEKTGYQNSSAYLLENAFYAITPTVKTTSKQLQDYIELVTQMGAVPIVTDYKKHDYSVAGISHLPHIIASSLVNLVKASDDEESLMRLLAAGGFKDITRIASSSPEMWEQICMTNSDAILSLLKKYIHSLEDIRNSLETADSRYIHSMFDNSREYRNSFTETASGPGKEVFKINCDIIDTEGSIAKVATILAAVHVSIKNIGIVYNREFEYGTLRIEFYDANARAGAIFILKEKGYTVYEN